MPSPGRRHPPGPARPRCRHLAAGLAGLRTRGFPTLRCRSARPFTPSACAGGLASPPPAVAASVAATECRAEPRKIKIMQPERSWYVPGPGAARHPPGRPGQPLDPGPPGRLAVPVARSAHPEIEPSPLRVRRPRRPGQFIADFADLARRGITGAAAGACVLPGADRGQLVLDAAADRRAGLQGLEAAR